MVSAITSGASYRSVAAERAARRARTGLAGTVETWLGASDRVTEGQFPWESGPQFWTGGVGGSPVSGTFANFVTGEPNDGGGSSDCVRMVAGGGWRDIQCTSSFRAVCERR